MLVYQFKLNLIQRTKTKSSFPASFSSLEPRADSLEESLQRKLFGISEAWCSFQTQS